MSKTLSLSALLTLLLLCKTPVSAQVDPSIPLRYKPVEIPDPLDTRIKQEQLKLQQQQIEIQRQEIERQQLENQHRQQAIENSRLRSRGNNAPLLTAGVCNGRLWHSLSTPEKLIYIVGFGEGAGMLISSLHPTDEAARLSDQKTWEETLSTVNFSNAEMQEQVDRLYADPTNLNIPVAVVYVLARDRLTGTNAQTLESQLVNFRATFDQLTK